MGLPFDAPFIVDKKTIFIECTASPLFDLFCICVFVFAYLCFSICIFVFVYFAVLGQSCSHKKTDIITGLGELIVDISRSI